MITLRQEKFIYNYIELGNATQAMIKAGYNSDYAGTNSHKLLNNTNVKAEIDRLRAEIKAEKVLDIAERKQKLSELAIETLLSSKGSVIRTSNIQAIVELNRMDQLTDKQPININYQAILDRAKEIEKDFIEGKYCDKTSERDIIEEGGSYV